MQSIIIQVDRSHNYVHIRFFSWCDVVQNAGDTMSGILMKKLRFSVNHNNLMLSPILLEPS